MNDESAPSPREVAALLRQPEGDLAIEVGLQMNRVNAGLNRQCIACLDLAPGQEVLEIGPGNAAFANEITAGAEGVRYTGLDWSAAMVERARTHHRQEVAAGRMRFEQGSTQALPFEPASFDRILGVHVAYFWEEPLEHLRELRRVMRPHARLCLAIGERSFMEELPFTSHGFRLYSEPEAREVLVTAGFDVLEVESYRESGTSNAGDYVDKRVNIYTCTPVGRKA